MKSIFLWNEDHSKAFDKIKSEIVNLTENTHFDVKKPTRVKTDDSHNGLGASLEQLYEKRTFGKQCPLLQNFKILMNPNIQQTN